jgi:hypothetical protein
VTDVVGRVAEVRDGLTRAPWIREVIPFDTQALAVLDRATAQAGRAEAEAPAIAQDEKPREPQLHQKTQLIARPGRSRRRAPTRLGGRSAGRFGPVAGRRRNSPKERHRATRRWRVSPPTALQRFENSEQAGASRSLLLLARDAEPRSRGLMLDGEASMIVSGFQASAGLSICSI